MMHCLTALESFLTEYYATRQNFTYNEIEILTVIVTKNDKSYDQLTENTCNQRQEQV